MQLRLLPGAKLHAKAAQCLSGRRYLRFHQNRMSAENDVVGVFSDVDARMARALSSPMVDGNGNGQPLLSPVSVASTPSHPKGIHYRPSPEQLQSRTVRIPPLIPLIRTRVSAPRATSERPIGPHRPRRSAGRSLR